METNRHGDIAQDACHEGHSISGLGLVYGKTKRPEDEEGVDKKKRPVKASRPLSDLQGFLRGATGLSAWCWPEHTLDDI